MKARRPHRVPLSGRAIEILGQALELTDGQGLIFPAARSGNAASEMVFTALLRRLGNPRRTPWISDFLQKLGCRVHSRVLGGRGSGSGPQHRQQHRGGIHAERPVRPEADADGRLGGLRRRAALIRRWTMAKPARPRRRKIITDPALDKCLDDVLNNRVPVIPEAVDLPSWWRDAPAEESDRKHPGERTREEMLFNYVMLSDIMPWAKEGLRRLIRELIESGETHSCSLGCVVRLPTRLGRPCPEARPAGGDRPRQPGYVRLLAAAGSEIPS